MTAAAILLEMLRMGWKGRCMTLSNDGGYDAEVAGAPPCPVNGRPYPANLTIRDQCSTGDRSFSGVAAFPLRSTRVTK